MRTIALTILSWLGEPFAQTGRERAKRELSRGGSLRHTDVARRALGGPVSWGGESETRSVRPRVTWCSAFSRARGWSREKKKWKSRGGEEAESPRGRAALGGGRGCRVDSSPRCSSQLAQCSDWIKRLVSPQAEMSESIGKVGAERRLWLLQRHTPLWTTFDWPLSRLARQAADEAVSYILEPEGP